MSKIPEVSIVIPVFNSELALPILTERVNEVFLVHKLSFELILVDDCSSDNSWQVIQGLEGQFSFVKALKNEQNLGQAYTTNKGISIAQGVYTATIDDDLEYNPEEIIDLYQAITCTGADVVFGIAPNKYNLQGKNPYFAKLRNKMLNFIWNKPTTDSFKIFKRALVFEENQCILSVPFEVFLKKRIKEVKIAYHDVGFNKRFHGKSNYTLWKKIRLFFQMSVN